MIARAGNDVITVAIGEDDSSCLMLIRHLLNRHSRCKIVGVGRTGKEALEMAERLKPDLLIVDNRMPLMDGLEVIQNLRQQNQNIKIILMSAHDHQLDYNALGADDFVQKGSAMAVWHEAIDKLFSNQTPYWLGDATRLRMNVALG